MAEAETKSGGGPVTSNSGVLFLALPYAVGALLIIALIFGVGGFLKGSWGAGAASGMIGASGFVLSIIGFILELVINKTVINAGSLIGGDGSIGISAGISIAWTIIRDVMNLAFIGGLMYAAFSMILQLNVFGGKPGKLVVNILIAALLVNFSYFFAGAIIDASNFTSKIVYEEALLGGVVQQDLSGIDTLYGPLTTNLMNVLGLQEIENGADLDLGENFLTFVYGFLVSLIIIATSLAFFEMAFIFIKRFVVIIYLLVTSPFAVVGFTGIPVIKEWGSQWWKTIAEQAIFPPVFFILIAIAYKIAEKGKEQFVNGNDTFVGVLSSSSGATNSVDLVSSIGNFTLFALLVIGMIYFAVRISQNISVGAANTPWKSSDIYKFAGNNLKIDRLGSIAGGVLGRPLVNATRGAGQILTGNLTPLKNLDVKKAWQPAFDSRPVVQKRQTEALDEALWGDKKGKGGYFNTGKDGDFQPWDKRTEDEQKHIQSLVQRVAGDEKAYAKLEKRAKESTTKDKDVAGLLKDALGRRAATKSVSPNNTVPNIPTESKNDLLTLEKKVENLRSTNDKDFKDILRELKRAGSADRLRALRSNQDTSIVKSLLGGLAKKERADVVAHLDPEILKDKSMRGNINLALKNIERRVEKETRAYGQDIPPITQKDYDEIETNAKKSIQYYIGNKDK